MLFYKKQNGIFMNNEEQVQENLDETQEKTTEKDRTSELEAEVLSLKDKLLRTAAEMENMRRRYEKQIDDVRDYSVSSFAKDMMSVMDNLTRALSHKPDEMEESVKNFIFGVEMTQKDLLNVFKKHGIEPVEPKSGDKFDYNLHHAISQIEMADWQSGIVVELMQAGYKIKDRLLRPASVVVTKAQAAK